MGRLKRVGHWLLDYWYIPAIVVGAILFWVISRNPWRNRNPIKRVLQELQVIKSGARARELEAELGAEQAKTQIMDEYRAKKGALDAEDERKVQELQENPQELARYLERISR